LKDLLSAYREQMSIPSFTGVLELVHAMPGRIRLRIPCLRRNVPDAEMFRRRLSGLKGIEQVSVNVFLGPVLIVYDPAVLTPMVIVSAATHCFEFEQLRRAHQSVLGTGVKNIRFALDQALLRNTHGFVDLRSAMTLLLLVVLIRGLLGRGSSAFNPLSVVWWLFQAIDR
jgi:hypothetical protein